MQQRTEIHRRISVRDFLEKGGKDEADWENTDEAKRLFEQLRAEQAEEGLCEKQAKRITYGDDEAKTKRRAFIQLFTTSKLGLGINTTGAGRRPNEEQSDFRKALIKAYDSRHPKNRKWLWCPILKEWVAESEATAAHLFAYMHGQAVMNSIFGAMDPPELFSPLNGILIASEVEAAFDKGLFVIVPRLSENASPAERSLWSLSDPKQYKIRLLDLDHPSIDEPIRPPSERTWRELDGTNVEFRSDFRPRARYLYFHHCLQILRRSWKEKHQGQSLKKEIGKAFWGTPGRYLPRSMLMSFVEELGHEFEQLMEGAIEDSATEADPTLLAASTSQIMLAGLKEMEPGEHEEYDEAAQGNEASDDNE